MAPANQSDTVTAAESVHDQFNAAFIPGKSDDQRNSHNGNVTKLGITEPRREGRLVDRYLGITCVASR
jgi:hypothetical protein